MSHTHIRKNTHGIVFLLLLMVLLFASGCGSKPVIKETVLLDLTFIAAPDINPSPRGRASPLSMRVFELRATDTFEDADYFVLQTNPEKALGDALLPGSDKFVIRPGAREIIRRKAHPDATALGIVAGYREMAGHVWQVVYPVPPPPDEGLFSSPEKIVLEIRLHETDMQVIPGKP